MVRTARAGVVVCLLVLLAAPVLAHVPSFPVDNTSPERAVEVPDAAKSWAFYDTLGGGGAKYYRFSLGAGERLQVGTFTPERSAFTPSIVVMSPSLNGTEGVPPGVTVPDGMGAIVVEGERPERPSYEPFAPAANYRTASLARPVDAETTYLVAIYEPENRSGPAGVSLGYEESFATVEYVRVPYDLVRTHLWEGQHPLVVVGPFLATTLGGVGAVWRKREGSWLTRPARLVLGGAGATVLASGVNTAVQLALALGQTGPTPAAVVTALFVVVPLVCGGWVLSLALRNGGSLSPRIRGGIAAAGVAALLTWAGFVVGPALLLAVAATPGRYLKA
ncbi:hypothetical protein [Haloarchaeobius sp. TZWWS8]|uniref:hypothetical protein n=1 Tax=Haloarchaeobius sp. TZWWS8 TaxID=3446121 RepID=UPI003EBFC607